MFGFGFGHGKRRYRGGVGGSPPALTAPTLTLTSSVGRRPVTWNSSADETIFAGYVYRLQVSTNPEMTEIVQDISHNIVAGEIDGLNSNYDLSGDGYSEPPLGTFYYWAWYERDDGEFSPKSDVMTVIIYDLQPDAFSFTNLTDQDPSTLVYSEIVTITGIEPGEPIDLVIGEAGFEAQINETGPWVTTGSVYNDDTVQLRGTTSADDDTPLETAVTIGGVTVTWEIRTAAGPGVVVATHRSTQNRGYGFGNTPATAWDAITIADGDKIVLHVFAQENVGTLSGITANGGAITFTQIGTTANVGNNRVSAWYADTSGVTSITPAFAVGSSVYGMSFAATSIVGAPAGAPAANAISIGYVAGPETIDMDGGLAAATDGVLLLTAVYEYNSAPPFTWSGATEANETDADTCALSTAIQTVAANVTINGAAHPSIPGPGYGNIGKIATQWDPA